MTNAAIAWFLAEMPGALKKAVAESRTILAGYDAIESSNSFNFGSASARLNRETGGGAGGTAGGAAGGTARRPLSPTGRVVMPVDCLASRSVAPALLPPFNATHAPPAPRITTTPSNAG